MDIRSFFSKKPSGGGGAAKPKTPPPAKSGSKSKKPTNGGETLDTSTASKKSPAKRRSSNRASSSIGNSRGSRKITMESKSKSKAPKQSKKAWQGGEEDDDEDLVEVVPPPAANASTKRMKNDTKTKDSGVSDDDAYVVEMASPSKSAAKTVSSPCSTWKKHKPETCTARGRRDSPSPISKKKVTASSSKKANASKASPPAKTTSGKRSGTGRRVAKKVDYREDDDDDDDGEDNGGGGDDDDDDAFSEGDDAESEEEEGESSDDGDFEDDESDSGGGGDKKSSRKRKKTTSYSSSSKSSSSTTGKPAVSSSKSGSKKSRAVIDDSSSDNDNDKYAADTKLTKSEHFSSSPTPTSAKANKSAAKTTTTTITTAAERSANGKRKKEVVTDLVGVGDTSSDEDEEEKQATTPPPRKKITTPSSSSSSSATARGTSSSGEKPANRGGGGFRPPWMGGGRKAPPNEGKKEVPVGADQCLTGKTFVVSGVLDSLGREAAEDLVKQYGGKVTGSVSSKTAYLLLGSVLDDGRPPEEGSKYKKAQQHKTKLIDEDDLFKMLSDSNPKGQSSSSSLSSPAKGAPPKAEAATSGEEGAAGAAAINSRNGSKSLAVNPYAPKTPIANPYGSSLAAAKKNKPAVITNPYAAAGKFTSSSGKPPMKGSSPPSSSSSLPSPSTSASSSNKTGQMWVDKYKPRSSSEVIGHAGQVKKLKFWLQNWERWHLGGDSGGGKPPMGKDNPGARAALLSGVPGVGKSSTATLVAREMGYHVMELNASDTRSKASLTVELASVIGNQVLAFVPSRGSKGNGKRGSSSSSSSGSSSSKNGGGGGLRKQLVVMDEVDGMGGSDRGGIQELIALIKKSQVPIIAICNDRQHQKIRSLVNHCYDLRFARPQKVTIAKRVKAIAKMEGMDVDDNAAEMLVEANGNDIRQVLHALQMWSRKSSKMSYMNLKGGLSNIEKDKMQRVGPFDAARTILGGASRTPLRERIDAFFTDYSLLPLLIHQNYLSSLMNVDPKIRTDVTASASAAVSDADIISGKMRGDVQHWELLPAQAALNVRVGSVGGGSLGFPEFPKWLGNYSRENKRRRLLGELSTHLNASISGGTEAVRLSYLHFLRAMLTKPLVDFGADGARTCVDLLEEYGLSRDDLFEVMPEFQLNLKGVKNPPRDVFASLDSKTKSAVTRCYNALSHKSQALVETMQAPKNAKKRKAPPKSVAMAAEEEEEDGEEEEQEEEEDDLSAFKKKGKARGGADSKAAGKSKSAPKPKAKRGKK